MSTPSTVSASNFTVLPAGALPADYVETDAAQINIAKIAHFLGIFSILGTGIFYLVKKNDPAAGKFAQDQMKEAFNFHLLVFAVAFVINIISIILAMMVPILGMLGLIGFALCIGSIVLSILNGLKASKGQVARYPARLPILK